MSRCVDHHTHRCAVGAAGEMGGRRCPPESNVPPGELRLVGPAGRDDSTRLTRLVPHPLLILGYSRFNFVRASSILNCQSTPRCLALVLSAQLPISDWSKGSSPMRRSVRH